MKRGGKGGLTLTLDYNCWGFVVREKRGGGCLGGGAMTFGSAQKMSSSGKKKKRSISRVNCKKPLFQSCTQGQRAKQFYSMEMTFLDQGKVEVRKKGNSTETQKKG